MKSARHLLIETPPDDTRHKLADLKRRKEHIELLEKQLVNERMAVERLEQELSGYYASIAPIYDCPVEVLTSVFEFHLSEHRGPRRIYELLSVCKHWRSVIRGNPQFWRDIVVSFEEAEWMTDSIHYFNSYLQDCVSNNQHLPINLTLDFWSLGITDWDGVYHNKSGQGVPRKMGKAAEEPEYSECYTSDRYIRSHKLIPALFKRCEDLYLRCQSLDIRSSDSTSLFRDIWLSLSVKMPTLTSLTLKEAGFPYSFYDRHMPGGPIYSPLLTRLDVDSIPDLDLIYLSRSIITHLSVQYEIGQSSTLGLSSFCSLEHLTIDAAGDIWEIDQNGSSEQEVVLPVLETLVLIGSFSAINYVHFELPKLQYLVLKTMPRNDYSEDPALPEISAPKVRWTNIKDARDEDWYEKAALTNLLPIMKHFDTTSSLFVPVEAREILLTAMRLLRERDNLPDSWTTVSLESLCGNIVETMEIADHALASAAPPLASVAL